MSFDADFQNGSHHGKHQTVVDRSPSRSRLLTLCNDCIDFYSQIGRLFSAVMKFVITPVLNSTHDDFGTDSVKARTQ